MGQFIVHGYGKDISVQYTDAEGDILEFYRSMGDDDGVIFSTGDDVAVASDDLIELFLRAAKMAEIEGTFVEESEYPVEIEGTRYVCGSGENMVSSVRGTSADLVRQVAANLLNVAAQMDADNDKAKADEAKALRTSAIALEALELYKRRSPSFWYYTSWDDTNHGDGSSDDTVKRWIERVEQKKEDESRPQVGDLVRVAADATTVEGFAVHFGRSVVGEMVRVSETGNYVVRTTDPGALASTQVVAPKFLTVVVPAAEVKTLRDSILLGARKYEDLTSEQQHLVDEVIRFDKEKK